MAFSKFTIKAVPYTVFKKVDVGLGDATQYMAPEELAQYTRFEMVREEDDVPGHDYVSVWNMVWDLEASEFSDAEGYAEIIRSSPYDLRQLIDKPGYFKEAIERVIERNKDNRTDNPAELAMSPGLAAVVERRRTINRYEYYMRAPRKIVEEYEESIKSKHETIFLTTLDDVEDAESSGDDVEIIGEIADNEIIRHIRNETGKRAHKMWVIEQNLDESTGTGIADNMEDVQASLIGMIRAFEDNKKLSANVTSAVKKRFFTNPNQLDDMIPGKQYDIADACDDVRKAIMPIVFPDVGESLTSGIDLMMQLKDDVSMIPTIMQGFTLPKHQPDTAYEMRELKESAGKYIGQAIRNDDEQLIEPEVTDLYEYNMIYGEDESCKVNVKVKANGFTSFQNKEIRGERMKQALALFTANEFLQPHIKIKPHLDVIYESMDEDPDKYISSEEELQQMAEQAQQAQAEAEQKILQMEAEKAKNEGMVKQEEKAVEHQGNMKEAEQKHQYALIEADNDHANKMEESDKEHINKMEEAEQEHVHTLEEEKIKASLEFLYPKKEVKPESQGGSKNA